MRTLINAVDEAGAVLAVAQRTAKLLSGLAKELGANSFTNEKLLRSRLELADIDACLADKFIARVWDARARHTKKLKQHAEIGTHPIEFAQNDFLPKA
jgi:hypothetical protein